MLSLRFPGSAGILPATLYNAARDGRAPRYASMLTVPYGFLPRRVCDQCSYEEIYLQLFSITAAVYTTPASSNRARKFWYYNSIPLFDLTVNSKISIDAVLV